MDGDAPITNVLLFFWEDRGLCADLFCFLRIVLTTNSAVPFLVGQVGREVRNWKIVHCE